MLKVQSKGIKIQKKDTFPKMSYDQVSSLYAVDLKKIMLQKFCKGDIRHNNCIHIRYGKMVNINNLIIQFE